MTKCKHMRSAKKGLPGPKRQPGREGEGVLAGEGHTSPGHERATMWPCVATLTHRAWGQVARVHFKVVFSGRGEEILFVLKPNVVVTSLLLPGSKSAKCPLCAVSGKTTKVPARRWVGSQPGAEPPLHQPKGHVLLPGCPGKCSGAGVRRAAGLTASAHGPSTATAGHVPSTWSRDLLLRHSPPGGGAATVDEGNKTGRFCSPAAPSPGQRQTWPSVQTLSCSEDTQRGNPAGVREAATGQEPRLGKSPEEQEAELVVFWGCSGCSETGCKGPEANPEGQVAQGAREKVGLWKVQPEGGVWGPGGNQAPNTE